MIVGGLIAARALHYVALALAFGAVAYGGFGHGDGALRRRLDVLALWASLGVLVTALLMFAAVAANLAGEASGAGDPAIWGVMLAETDFGRVWTVRLALATLLVVLCWLALAASDRRAFSVFSIGLAGGLAATVALTGHAQVESGWAGLLHRASDALHLLAAVVWIGVLPPLLVLLTGRTDATGSVRRLQGFHTVGLIAVATLIATGLVNSWFLVGDAGRLLTTPYGLVLMLKLLLFAGMVLLAADNRLRLVPGFAAANNGPAVGEWGRRLRRSIWSELALSVAVLITVAVLGAIAPAAEV